MTAGPTGTATVDAPVPGAAPESDARRGIALLFKLIPPIWIIFAVLMAVIFWKNPGFAKPAPLLAFLKAAAPLMILAVGQLFVIVTGEFDLSVGSLITTVVIVAARVTDGDAGRTWPVIALLFAIGIGVGLINGLITTRLRVPSFITTLGMLLVLNGAAFYWTHGSPRGSLPKNFRVFGREGFEGIPGIRQLPYSVVILLVLTAVAIFVLHHSRFGHQVFATGGNPRAAAMSGVNVGNIRLLAFVISACSAVVAGILLGGFAGVSQAVGAGYEFQAISAVVLGGAVLGGGRGTAGAALGGALSLQAMFTLLNLFGHPKPLRDTVQGAVIIAAAAFASYRLRARR